MTDATLNLFCGKDEVLRPNMVHPWIWRDYTGATDGHSMVLVPGKDARYKPIDLNIEKSLPQPSSPREFSVEKIREALNTFPWVEELEPETVSCEECDGSGSRVCGECGNDGECKECDGSGKVNTNTKPTGRFIPNDEAICSLDYIPFRQALLRKLIAVADELKATTFTAVSPAVPSGSNEFMVGDLRVVLMPVRGEATVEVHSKEELVSIAKEG